MGLRNGDIIKRINNMTIENPEQAIEVYQQLQNATSLTIEIQRGKRRRVFNYEIR
jgi:type II secretory pathway component PulC